MSAARCSTLRAARCSTLRAPPFDFVLHPGSGTKRALPRDIPTAAGVTISRQQRSRVRADRSAI